MKRNKIKDGRFPSEQGGAMVEFAVLMLVFVPLILLPMYFQDAWRYKLDMQEAVASSTWDFAVQNYTEKSISDVSGTVTDVNKALFKNLWVGDENDKRDPAGPWADFKWESEVACEQKANFGSEAFSLSPLASAYLGSKWGNKGGLVTCSGQISITNYFVPQFFLQEGQKGTAQEDLFKPGKDTMKVNEYKFGIMVDPWAVDGCDDGSCEWNNEDYQHNNIEKQGEGDDPNAKQFYDRTKYVWGEPLTFMACAATWEVFVMMAMAKQLLSPLVLFDDIPFFSESVLDLNTIHLPSEKYTLEGGEGLGGPGSYYTNPDKDGSDDNYDQTLSNRGKVYLGCNQLTWDYSTNCN